MEEPGGSVAEALILEIQKADKAKGHTQPIRHLEATPELYHT
jgi:hypothetical protein